MTNFIHSSTISLAYEVEGHGMDAIIFLHGYGKDATMWQELSAVLPFEGKKIFLDLPFHGKTQVMELKNILKTDLQKMFSMLFVKESVQSLHLIGYSLGGRWAMCVAECFPEMVKSLILIAPDGLVKSRWYGLVTKPGLWRWLFECTVQHHWILQSILEIAFRTRLINKSIRNFVEKEMNTPEKRQRVYNTWVYMRSVFPKKDFLTSKMFTTVIVAASYDRVIPASALKKVAMQLGVPFYSVPCGHTSVVLRMAQEREYFKIIQKILLKA